VKNRLLSGVLAVTGILALSATAAHAGGVGNPVALTSFFSCHQINGVSLGTKVDVYSNEVGSGASTPSRANVSIGQSILACAQAFLFKAGVVPNGSGTPEDPFTNNISPQISTFPLTFELKCYTASVSKKTGDEGLFNAEDALFSDAFGLPTGSTETVPALRDPKLICAPASFTGQ
jgi:hypothetical protein